MTDNRQKAINKLVATWFYIDELESLQKPTIEESKKLNELYDFTDFAESVWSRDIFNQALREYEWRVADAE